MAKTRKGNECCRRRMFQNGLFRLAICLTCMAVQPGCSRSVVLGEPRWGQPDPRHRLVTATVMTTVDRETLLYVGGAIDPPGYAYDDYQFVIQRMEDDTGKELALKAFWLKYSKATFVNMVFEEPAKGAKTVKMDITFETRRGKQRIIQELPFKRVTPGPGLRNFNTWPTTQPSPPTD
jgi:hypothetical protein